MVFELIGDMLSNSSPIYMHVGILWSMVAAFQLINMNMDSFQKYNRFCVRQTYTFQIDSGVIQEPDIVNMDFKTWMVHKMKQMESPDDDSDDDSFSFFHKHNDIRGGNHHCVNNLYSRSLKNIVLSGLY